MLLSLYEQQQAFINGLCGQSLAIVPMLQSSATLDASECLEIYRRSLLGKLSEALTDVYPVCQRLVGAQFFGAMARRFIQTTPSGSTNIHHYGNTLADFMATFPALHDLPYLPDVARLEWAWHEVFCAVNTPHFDFSALSQLPVTVSANVRFHLPAAARLLCSAYPVHTVWQVNQPEYAGDATVSLIPGEYTLLIWRHNLEMRIDLLQPEEWVLLNALAAGETLSVLSEQLMQNHGLDLSQWLPHGIARGYIAGFSL